MYTRPHIIDQESAADLTKALVSIQSYQFRSLCKTDKDIVSLTKLVFIAGLLYLIAWDCNSVAVITSSPPPPPRFAFKYAYIEKNSAKHTPVLAPLAFFFLQKHTHSLHSAPRSFRDGLVAWADQQRLLLNTERKGQKSCLVFPGPGGNSSQQIVFRRAGRQGRPAVEMLMQKEARRGWGQGYPVSHCLSAPPLSPLITPSPLSPQQSPWETNLSSFREGWRWGRDGPRMHLVCHSHYSTSASLGTDRLQINLVLNSLHFIIHSFSLSLSLSLSLSVFVPLWYSCLFVWALWTHQTMWVMYSSCPRCCANNFCAEQM